MRVVLDTSVLVAAWRSSAGASFAALRHLGKGDFEVAVSVPLVLEYEAALLRHTDAPRTAADVEALLDYVCLVAHKQAIFFLWRPLLKDPNDDMVVEVAVAAQCDGIVTHNVRDFAAASATGVRVMTPAELLLLLRR